MSVIGSARVRPLGRAVAPARPVWESAFRDPIVEGHVRLRGLSWTERQAARFGLVTLGLLLGSLLLGDIWRKGTLLPIGDGAGLTFLPLGLLGATLVCLALAWTMLCWGALTAAWPVKLLVATTFVLTNASLSVGASIEIGDSRALRWGPDIVTGAYVATAALVVASVGLRWLPARVEAVVLPLLRVLVVVSLAGFFLTHLWINNAFSAEGFPAVVQQQVSGAITEIDGLLMPLVYVSAVLVIDFALNTAIGVAQTTRETTLTVARWLLVGLLAVKVWFLVLDDPGVWVTLLHDRPAAVARTAVSVLMLAVLVWLLTRGEVSEREEDVVDTAKERLLYLSALALSFPMLVSILVVGSGIVAISQLDARAVPAYVREFPTDAVAQWGQPGLAALFVVLGLLMMRRRTPIGRELGSGLVVVGAWAFPSLVLNQTELEIGFSDPLVDVMVTLAVVAVVAAAWRRLTTSLVVVLAAVTVFTWLAMTKGDWIGLVGSWFGFPAIVVVVVGVVFSVLGDAGFTASTGRVVPQGARVLMFVGYLVLSVTILHWVEATHASSHSEFLSDAAFFFIGIPWAAWTIGRKLVHLD